MKTRAGKRRFFAAVLCCVAVIVLAFGGWGGGTLKMSSVYAQKQADATIQLSIAQGHYQTILVNGTTQIIAEQKVNNTWSEMDAGTLTWTSDKTSVATVIGGSVTGISKGTAKITAKSGNSSKTITIEVIEDSQIIKAIQITGQTTIAPKKSEQLDLTVIPTGEKSRALDNVVWTSSDTSIATVDQDGKVTGVKEGTVWITATLNATNNAGIEVDTKIEITVNGDAPRITTESLKDATVGESYEVTLQASGKSGDTLTWSVSDTDKNTLKAYGLELTSAGVLKGTPTKATETDKPLTFTVTVTSKDTKLTDSQTLSLTIKEATNVTITFTETKGGTTLSTKTIAKGGKLTSSDFPSTPVRTGYTFDGWYYTKDGVEKQWTASDTFDANTTIYAKWTATTTQTTNPEGGRNVTSPQTSDRLWALWGVAILIVVLNGAYIALAARKGKKH